MKFRLPILLSFLFYSGQELSHKNPTVDISQPEELYGQLFYDVQSNEQLFTDSKTFVDAIPRFDVNIIKKKYSRLKDRSDSSLKQFIAQNFILPSLQTDPYTDTSFINEHITKLWDVLLHPPDEIKSGTLIPLPNSYIVPGGRFREVYYWDSYFTMLGLEADNKVEIMQNMVDNFAYLINQYGFIPNGNRTYYLSRSQPPFFCMMVDLLARKKGNSVYTKYLPELEKEYSFWMNGSDQLIADNSSYRRVVRLQNGAMLNRYWDDVAEPRAESYREDIATANKACEKLPQTKREDVYRNIRAAAESGWDFSSRWMEPDSLTNFHLYTIQTTDIIPVDLNCILFELEKRIGNIYATLHDTLKSNYYYHASERRKLAINNYCWNNTSGFFTDYNFKQKTQSTTISLAGIYPLFFSVASAEQAKAIAKKIQTSFLFPGGVITTLTHTEEQWDAPNGWAPLQWITIIGLENYDYIKLADTIKKRWLNFNKKVYESSFKLVEKYNVKNINVPGGGGEYPTQDGFGWTNGVYQKLSTTITGAEELAPDSLKEDKN